MKKLFCILLSLALVFGSFAVSSGSRAYASDPTYFGARVKGTDYDSYAEINVLYGDDALLEVEAFGPYTTLEYQWYQDGTALPNTDSPSYTVQGIQHFTEFECRVNNGTETASVWFTLTTLKASYDDSPYVSGVSDTMLRGVGYRFGDGGPNMMSLKAMCGSEVTLHVDASDDKRAVDYKWYTYTNDGMGTVELGTLSSVTVQIPLTKTRDGSGDIVGFYMCDVKDAQDFVETYTFMVYYDSGLDISDKDTGECTVLKEVSSGESIDLEVKAFNSNGAGITYMWDIEGLAGAGTSSAYSLTNITGSTYALCNVYDGYLMGEVCYYFNVPNNMEIETSDLIVSVSPGGTAHFEAVVKSCQGAPTFEWCYENCRGLEIWNEASESFNGNTAKCDITVDRGTVHRVLKVSDESGASTYIVFTAYVPVQLSLPRDLEWSKDYTGEVSWKVYDTDLTQNQYEICLFDADTGDLIDFTRTTFINSTGVTQFSSFMFLWDERDSGNYYFTIRSIGDGVGYLDSETARSDVWHYEAPSKQLDAPSDLNWTIGDDGYYYANWKNARPDFGGYEIRIYYTDDPQSDPELFTGSSAADYSCELKRLEPSAISVNGAGYYSFNVRQLSNEIEGILPSPWSEMSDPIYISDINLDLNSIVAGVDEDSSAQEIEEAVEQVRQLDFGEIENSIAADTENTQAAGQLAKLEELAGRTATVEVSDSMETSFDETKVDVIGAGLNVDAGQSVRLQIDRAEEDHVLPTQYNNSVAFSMTIVDNDTGEEVVPENDAFDVPIKITLPIPARINPDFLVLLHYNADGTYENVQFKTFKQDGQWYVSFVVTHFSDFVMAQEGTPVIKGDVNGDGEVDANDLTVLSRHVAKIEEIEDEALLQAADINGDGDADANDLTILSRYVAHIISDFD